MIGRLALILLLLSASACDAPQACEDSVSPFDNDGTRITSPAFEGSQLFSDAGDQLELRFRAHLIGLPELWPADSAVLSGAVLTNLRLSYESDPRGSDGRTEMPRVGVVITPRNPLVAEPQQTSSVPDGDFAFSGALFDTCERGERCCHYGARECSLRVRVSMKRLDGAEFPPLRVDWVVKAQANVSMCPLGGTTPELTLEREAE